MFRIASLNFSTLFNLAIFNCYWLDAVVSILDVRRKSFSFASLIFLLLLSYCRMMNKQVCELFWMELILGAIYKFFCGGILLCNGGIKTRLWKFCRVGWSFEVLKIWGFRLISSLTWFKNCEKSLWHFGNI